MNLTCFEPQFDARGIVRLFLPLVSSLSSLTETIHPTNFGMILSFHCAIACVAQNKGLTLTLKRIIIKN